MRAFKADGTAERTLSPATLGSSAESLAASPATGLWMLSCCGAAPAGQALVQQRDAASLAPLGSHREFAPFGGLLAAGPSGVWFADGDSGQLRRASGLDRPADDPVVEDHPDQLGHDLLAVASVGPVLVQPRELLTVDAKTLAVRRTALPAGLASPTALTVANTGYLAFADRIVRCDLAALTETGTYPITGVTALTAGPDGVWAATSGRLIRVDTLPAHPPALTPAYRSIAGLQGMDDLVDVDGHLWVSAVTDTSTNAGTLSRVDLADGTLHPERPGGPGAVSTDGSRVFVDHAQLGVVDIFAAGGESLKSKNFGAHAIAGSKAGLSVLSCCDASTPDQHIRLFDPITFTQLGQPVNIQAQGEDG